MPKVSVIIPIYGVQKYIERCARSLFEQTLDDIEFIFVNDCTPDNSVKVLEDTLSNYPERRHQVRIFNLPQNMGAAQARKVGIFAARGEYVIHCDSDDWVDIHIYEILYNEATVKKADIVICDMYKVDSKTQVQYTQTVSYNKDRYLRDLISRKTTCSICNKLVSKSIVQSDKIIYPESHMLEDQLLCVQYVFYASKYIYIQKPLYYYFVNSLSVCHRLSEDACRRRAIDAQNNINLLLTFLQRKGLLKEYRHEIVRLKYTPRVFIWPLLLDNPKHYLPLWKSFYPEINCKYFFTKGISFILKFIFLLAILGIYPVIYKILKR